MKKANTYKGKLGWQSEFSHRYACWANNHNGWAKAKKSNKRLAKRRLKDELRKELVYSAVDHVVALRSEGEDDLANMLPACRSCNHYKRGNSLEGWRRILEAMPATLERDCYTYRQAVRFGMVKPTPKKITFYFERRCI